MLQICGLFFFGWFSALIFRALVVAAVIVLGVLAKRAVEEWRRTHGGVQKKPSFHDQVMHEMSQLNEAIERGMKRSAERTMVAANLSAEEWEAGGEAEQETALTDLAVETPQVIPQTDQEILVVDIGHNDEAEAVPMAKKAMAAAAGAASGAAQRPQPIPPSWVGSDRP